MPANKKHLTKSPWQRFLKVTAGLAGGYLVTAALQFFLLHFFNGKEVMVTMFFGTYLIWAALMIFAFLARNGWKIWGIYALSSMLLLTPAVWPYFFD